MCASALVTMEITVMEFRQWEGLLRREMITAPRPPLATLQLRHAVDAKCARHPIM